MRHLLLAALTALFTVTAAPAFAASIVDFSYAGTVSSDVTVGPLFTSVFGQNLTGKPVFISETFNLGNANVVSNGSFTGTLGGSNNFASAEITIGNVSAPLMGNFGTFIPTLGGFSSEIGMKQTDQIFSLLDFLSKFDFTQNRLVADGSLELTNFPAIRTLDFNVSSETIALSPVPLPPTLPLFASALLALGFAGYAWRKRDAVAAMAAQT